jgi:hypothetical protein
MKLSTSVQAAIRFSLPPIIVIIGGLVAVRSHHRKPLSCDVETRPNEPTRSRRSTRSKQ